MNTELERDKLKSGSGRETETETSNNPDLEQKEKNENYVKVYAKKTEKIQYVQDNISDSEKVSSETISDLENQIRKNLPRMGNIIEGLEQKLSDPNLPQDVKESLEKRIEGLKELKNKSEEVLSLIEKQKNKESSLGNQIPEKAIANAKAQTVETAPAPAPVVEKFESYNQIISEIIKTKNELAEVIKDLSSENLDPKLTQELEIKAKELIEKIKNLEKQLGDSSENINEENLKRATEIQTEIRDLNSEPDSENKQRRLQELKSEYSNLIVETDQELGNYKSLITEVQNSKIDTTNQRLNVDLVQDINATLNKLDSSLGEKFKRIEANNRVNSLS